MQLEAWNGLSSGLADCQRMIKGVNSISHPTLHRKDAPFIKVNNISAPDSLETVHVDRYQGPYRVFFPRKIVSDRRIDSSTESNGRSDDVAAKFKHVRGEKVLKCLLGTNRIEIQRRKRALGPCDVSPKGGLKGPLVTKCPETAKVNDWNTEEVGGREVGGWWRRRPVIHAQAHTQQKQTTNDATGN